MKKTHEKMALMHETIQNAKLLDELYMAFEASLLLQEMQLSRIQQRFRKQKSRNPQLDTFNAIDLKGSPRVEFFFLRGCNDIPPSLKAKLRNHIAQRTSHASHECCKSCSKRISLC